MEGIDKKEKSLIKLDTFKTIDSGYIIGKKSSEKDFICSVCGKHFGSSANIFSIHMKTTHGIDIIQVDILGKEYKSLI